MGRSMDQLALMTGHINPLIFFKPIEILFSSEVNAIAESEEEAISKTKMFALNYKLIVKQSIQVVNKMYDINPIQSYSIVEMNGCYVADNGEVFEEKSYSLKILGLEENVGKDLAEVLCVSFQQESVMFRVGETNNTLINIDSVEIAGQNPKNLLEIQNIVNKVVDNIQETA